MTMRKVEKRRVIFALQLLTADHFNHFICSVYLQHSIL
jgi:hypothetical protein